MICNKCKHIIVCHAFSEGTCEEYSDKIITSHIPCYKLCEVCSDKLNKCQQCGEEFNMYEATKNALEELKEMWQTDQDINRHTFIDVDDLFEENYTRTEIDEICREFVDKANEYLKNNSSWNYVVKYDGVRAYVVSNK